MVEIIEYWDKVKPLFETMTRENYDKKCVGEPYEVLYSSTEAPWYESPHIKDTAFIETKERMTIEEFNNKFKP